MYGCVILCALLFLRSLLSPLFLLRSCLAVLNVCVCVCVTGRLRPDPKWFVNGSMLSHMRIK